MNNLSYCIGLWPCSAVHSPAGNSNQFESLLKIRVLKALFFFGKRYYNNSEVHKDKVGKPIESPWGSFPVGDKVSNKSKNGGAKQLPNYSFWWGSGYAGIM